MKWLHNLGLFILLRSLTLATQVIAFALFPVAFLSKEARGLFNRPVEDYIASCLKNQEKRNESVFGILRRFWK